MAGHAGTVPMDHRRDALAGAAEFALAVEAAAATQQGMVATVGKLEVEPGVANVIPRRQLSGASGWTPDRIAQPRPTSPSAIAGVPSYSSVGAGGPARHFAWEGAR